MKKLNKLVISPEKIMKNEELINLQGGYQGWCCECQGYGFMGGADTEDDCIELCADAYNAVHKWHC